MEGGVLHRGEETEDLIHVQDGPEARCSGLGPRPPQYLVQQHGYEEHPLPVGKMADGEYRSPGPSVGGVEEPTRVQGVSLHPGREGGGRRKVVQFQDQVHPCRGGVEGLQIQHSEGVEGRHPDHPHEGGNVQRFPPGPLFLQHPGDEDMLPARQRVGFNPYQRQEARCGGLDPLPEEVAVGFDRLRRGVEGAQGAHHPPGGTARRVDRQIDRFPHFLDPGAVDTPFLQALLPGRGGLPGQFLGRKPLPGSLLGVYPGQEVPRRKSREGQKQVGQVSLGVDGYHGNLVYQGFLDERDGEPRLAAAGHPDDHPVGGEVPGVVEEQFARR